MIPSGQIAVLAALRARLPHVPGSDRLTRRTVSIAYEGELQPGVLSALLDQVWCGRVRTRNNILTVWVKRSFRHTLLSEDVECDLAAGLSESFGQSSLPFGATAA